MNQIVIAMISYFLSPIKASITLLAKPPDPFRPLSLPFSRAVLEHEVGPRDDPAVIVPTAESAKGPGPHGNWPSEPDTLRFSGEFRHGA